MGHTEVSDTDPQNLAKRAREKYCKSLLILFFFKFLVECSGYITFFLAITYIVSNISLFF